MCVNSRFRVSSETWLDRSSAAALTTPRVNRTTKLCRSFIPPPPPTPGQQQIPSEGRYET